MRSGSEVRFWLRVGMCPHVPDRSLPRFYDGCAQCCWLWQGAANQAGYGRTRYTLLDGEEIYAHRVAWAMAHQGMCPPPTLEICHTCDVRRCCNPSHLFVGTHLENIRDRERKARGNMTERRGGPRPRKLTWGKVAEIRELGRLARFTQAQIGRQYGVSTQMVSNILCGRAWGRPSEH